jgi:hypothetical protein
MKFIPFTLLVVLVAQVVAGCVSKTDYSRLGDTQVLTRGAC